MVRIQGDAHLLLRLLQKHHDLFGQSRPSVEPPELAVTALIENDLHYRQKPCSFAINSQLRYP